MLHPVCCTQLGQGAAIERFEEKPGGQIRADMSMDWAELLDFNSESHVSEVRPLWQGQHVVAVLG